MKKIILFSAIFGLIASSAVATTDINLSPTSFTVKANQTFSLNIVVNPNGVKNYTVKTQLKYPADLVEVTNFTFASNWLVLSQPGYDSVDNASGVMIKTGGYAQGTTSTATFGTVTFRAKKTGSGKLTVGSDTVAMDQNSQNVFSGVLASANLAITAGTPTPTPTTIAGTVRTPTPRPAVAVVKTPTTSVSPSPTPTTTTEPSPSETPAESPISDGGGLLATIGTVASLGTDSKPLAVIVIIAVLAFLYWLIRKLFFRKAPTV